MIAAKRGCNHLDPWLPSAAPKVLRKPLAARMPVSTACSTPAESRGYERGRKEGEAAGRAAASALYATEIARVAEAVERLRAVKPDAPTARVLDPFNLSGPRDDETPAVTHRESSKDASILADALIPDARPVRKSRANGAASAGVPMAGAMQLLNTAVTHWPVLHLESACGVERPEGARRTFQHLQALPDR
jgi:hypothetical protein